MKKFRKISVAIVVLFSHAVANAGGLGGEIELGVWNTTHGSHKVSTGVSHDNVIMIAAQMEQPIPLIPNVRIDGMSIDRGDIKVSQAAFTGYYQLVDNDSVELDVGAGVTAAYKGSFTHYKSARTAVIDLKREVTNIEDVMPHVYAAANITVPFVKNLSVFSNYYKYTNGRSSGYDLRGGIKYGVSLVGVSDVNIRVGYRTVNGDFLHKMKSLNSDGVYASVSIAV